MTAAQAVDRLKAAGGRVNGSLTAVGATIGTKSKTTAHRTLRQLAAAGLVELRTGTDGVSVAVA